MALFLYFPSCSWVRCSLASVFTIPLNLFLPRSSVTFSIYIQWMSVHLYCIFSRSSSFLKYFFSFWDACSLVLWFTWLLKAFFPCLSLKSWCFAECGPGLSSDFTFLIISHFLLQLLFPHVSNEWNSWILRESVLNSKLVRHPHPCPLSPLNSPCLQQTPWSSQLCPLSQWLASPFSHCPSQKLGSHPWLLHCPHFTFIHPHFHI